MAPRGIIAAATASTFGPGLSAAHVGGAQKILPVTFLAIVLPVTLYGLTGPVYRLRLELPSHGVVAPYTGGETLFNAELTRPAVIRRYQAGAGVAARSGTHPLPAASDVLFVIRADTGASRSPTTRRLRLETGTPPLSLTQNPGRPRLTQRMSARIWPACDYQVSSISSSVPSSSISNSTFRWT